MDNLRLSNGLLFPMPITLDVSRTDVERWAITPGTRIALLDPRDESALSIITGISSSSGQNAVLTLKYSARYLCTRQGQGSHSGFWCR